MRVGELEKEGHQESQELEEEKQTTAEFENPRRPQ